MKFDVETDRGTFVIDADPSFAKATPEEQASLIKELNLSPQPIQNSITTSILAGVKKPVKQDFPSDMTSTYKPSTEDMPYYRSELDTRKKFKETQEKEQAKRDLEASKIMKAREPGFREKLLGKEVSADIARSNNPVAIAGSAVLGTLDFARRGAGVLVREVTGMESKSIADADAGALSGIRDYVNKNVDEWSSTASADEAISTLENLNKHISESTKLSDSQKTTLINKNNETINSIKSDSPSKGLQFLAKTVKFSNNILTSVGEDPLSYLSGIGKIGSSLKREKTAEELAQQAIKGESAVIKETGTTLSDIKSLESIPPKQLQETVARNYSGGGDLKTTPKTLVHDITSKLVGKREGELLDHNIPEFDQLKAIEETIPPVTPNEFVTDKTLIGGEIASLKEIAQKTPKALDGKINSILKTYFKVSDIPSNEMNTLKTGIKDLVTTGLTPDKMRDLEAIINKMDYKVSGFKEARSSEISSHLKDLGGMIEQNRLSKIESSLGNGFSNYDVLNNNAKNKLHAFSAFKENIFGTKNIKDLASLSFDERLSKVKGYIQGKIDDVAEGGVESLSAVTRKELNDIGDIIGQPVLVNQIEDLGLAKGHGYLLGNNPNAKQLVAETLKPKYIKEKGVIGSIIAKTPLPINENLIKRSALRLLKENANYKFKTLDFNKINELAKGDKRLLNISNPTVKSLAFLVLNSPLRATIKTLNQDELDQLREEAKDIPELENKLNAIQGSQSKPQ